MQKSQPYDKLAFIYDRLMSHVNYKIWADYVINLFQYADRKIKTVIDISCGTGTLLSNFSKKRYNYWGCDLSYPMVVQAQKKIKQILLMVSDVNYIAAKSNKFDAVLFLYDSLNYMRDEKQIDYMFAEVNRILNKDGLFIFDIITDLLCKTHYKNYEEQENWGDSGYIRHSFYDESRQVQHNDFRISIGKDIFCESHVQTVFSESQISKGLNQNGFEVKAQLDDFTFHQSDDESERIHYVCKKK